MSTPNAEQIEHWNGDEARHWIDEHDRYDCQLAPFGDAVLRAAAINSSDRVLDIGCGCGHTTFLAAQHADTALGVDISAPMLEHARGHLGQERLWEGLTRLRRGVPPRAGRRPGRPARRGGAGRHPG